jgi:putative nucleotidyltransferase with HDIG domain
MTSQSGSTPSPDALNRIIEKAKQELEHMIDMNPQIMVLTDRQHRVVRANRSLLDLLGYSGFENVLGTPLEVLFPCRPGALDALFVRDAGHETLEVEVSFPGRSQSQLLHFKAFGSGNSLGLFAVMVHDVTEERERLATIEKRHKLEAVEALAGGLMHAINQPLTVIMLQAHLMHLALEQDATTSVPELKEKLEQVMMHTMQISDILRQIESPRDYVTVPYSQGVDILDLSRTGGGGGAGETVLMETQCMSFFKVLTSVMSKQHQGYSGHAHMTARCAGRLARQMGLSDEEVHRVERCGLFHDIGKIGIHDGILEKPGPLTENERELIKTHTEFGHALLRVFSFFDREAEVAYAHHERYDGSGYPRGLVGEKIPLFARIVSVADTFDTMRSWRSYSPPVELGKIREEIQSQSGRQFDARVVDAFLRCCGELERFCPNKGTGCSCG